MNEAGAIDLGLKINGYTCWQGLRKKTKRLSTTSMFSHFGKIAFQKVGSVLFSKYSFFIIFV